MTRAVVDAVAIPVVASGGAGNPEHSAGRSGQEAGASAALAASIFHYRHYSIRETKEYLAQPRRARPAVDRSLSPSPRRVAHIASQAAANRPAIVTPRSS